MKVWLVGGAVRDRLLQLPVTDRDWVVTGASPREMLDQGYRQVGADFPVFLHPDSGEEYALARTERKTGHGYGGFAFDFNAGITLEEDLERRDLTINAMAEDADGQLVDPYGGLRDLDARLLRHVSPAFSEDPLRVLRVARFAARFHGHGFTIAPETMQLMSQLAGSGELAHLVAERVWQETARALQEQRPDVFVSVLRACGALKVVFPEVDALFGVPQRAQWHPEVDTGQHLLLCLQQAARMNLGPTARFAVLMHDLGKAVTPEDVLPSHRGHEEAGVPLVKAFCERLRIPKQHRELAVLVCRYHLQVHTAFELRTETILKLLERADVFRRAERFADLLFACEADARGREGLQDSDYPQARYLSEAARAACDARLEGSADMKGPDIARALRALRLQKIEPVREKWRAEYANGG